MLRSLHFKCRRAELSEKAVYGNEMNDKLANFTKDSEELE